MEDIDILCINCENMISSEKVAGHSRICIKPSEYFLHFDNSSQLQWINFRIQKLNNALESVQSTLTKASFSKQRLIYSFLVRQARQILCIKTINEENLEICLKIAKGLENYTKIPPDNWHAVIYYERLKILILTKCDIFIEQVKKFKKHKRSASSLSDILTNPETTAKSFVSEIEGLKSAYHKPQKSRGYIDLNTLTSALDIRRLSSAMNSYSETGIYDTNEFDLEFDRCVYGKTVTEENDKGILGKKGIKSKEKIEFYQINRCGENVKSGVYREGLGVGMSTDHFKISEVWSFRKNS